MTKRGLLLVSVLFTGFFTLLYVNGITVNAASKLDILLDEAINACYTETYQIKDVNYLGSANICNHTIDLIKEVCDSNNSLKACKSEELAKYLKAEFG